MPLVGIQKSGCLGKVDLKRIEFIQIIINLSTVVTPVCFAASPFARGNFAREV
jgi:hypothetical protein